jgi:hypothetical protein
VASANKNQTKAAKAVAGASGAAVSVGDGLRMLTPLNSGKHAYVNSGGRSVHVATTGDAFLDLMRELVANGQENRVRTELALLAQEYPQHAWPAVRDRVEAQLFAPAQDEAADDTEDEAAA